MKVNQLLIKAYEILKESKSESYMIDAQLLLCHVLNVEKLYIIMNRDTEVSKEKEAEFLKLINLRKNKMPIKYITGTCEFMGLDFNIKNGVLIPRPDTETLVEECIKIINKNKLKQICDVCCGSGAIGISICKYTNNTNVKLYDISDTALEVTSENIKKLDAQSNCEVYFSDLLSKAKEENLKFDIIVSNPPYIKSKVINTLMEDVKNYEPLLALDGGEDGLEFYRKITKQAKELLNPNGFLAFEIGNDEKNDVVDILKESKFKDIYFLKDLYENDRVVIGNI